MGRHWKDLILTDKYKDAIHVVFESINTGLVMAFCFFSINGPERICTAFKVAYHAHFLGVFR